MAKNEKNKKEALDEQERLARNIEGLKRRQSAPTPTMEDYARRQIPSAQAPTAPAPAAPQDNGGAVNGLTALDMPVKKETVQRARQIMLKYKQGKANLEARIVENEQWYKLRHWERLAGKRSNEVEPTSAWLFNCLANKHADAMDNFPSPNILPREESDKAEAKLLSAVIPVILDRNDFEQVYADVWTYKLKAGTGVYGVFWDQTKENGVGDVSIKKADLLNLFWEPGLTDVQDSPNLFSVELADNEALLGAYPFLAGKLTASADDIAKYVYDDSVDTSEKSMVVDWYYKRRVGGKTVLHYCKFVGDEVLYATENDPALRERGWYDHGLYPFIFDPLFRVEGSPAGFGYVDVGRSPQEYIDRIGKAILENTLANTRPRHFIREEGSVNEEEYADITKDFVHVAGASLGEDSIRPIDGKPLAGVYYDVYRGKIEELKETTGNRDVNAGGHASGVTAASAIAAMQEAGSKLSRDNSKAAYRAYKRMIYMVIELIRQYYTLPRQFRIAGEHGAQQFLSYSNARLQAQPYEATFGDPAMERLLRKPEFDVLVSVQRASPYSKLSQNELALQFYSAGMFDPARADQALLCMEMMDFDGKASLTAKIAENAIRFQRQQASAPALSGAKEPLKAKGLNELSKKTEPDDFGGLKAKESPVTKKARQEAAKRTDPT